MKTLLFTALFAVAWTASALTVDEVTAKQVEATKYGMDKGCRGQSAKSGDSPEKINAVCGCTNEILNARLTFRQWQEVYFYDRTNQDEKGAKIYQEHLPAIRECVSRALRGPGAQPADTARPAPSILGIWDWTVKKNGCKESYTFKPNGVMEVMSGAERTESTYEISPTIERSGRYKMVAKVVKDFGGVDCGGSDDDSAGQVNTFYLLFTFEGATMAMCFSEGGMDCMGPLKKRQ
jgi:hypothetical protein